MISSQYIYIKNPHKQNCWLATSLTCPSGLVTVTLWIWNFHLRGERQPLPCSARHDHLSGRNMDTERQLHTHKDNDRVSGFSYRKHTSSVTEVEQNCIFLTHPKTRPPSEITTSSQLCIYWRRDFASITKTTDWAAGATAFIKSCCGGTRPDTQLSRPLTGAVHLFFYRVMALSKEIIGVERVRQTCTEPLYSSPSRLHPQMPSAFCISLSLYLPCP